MNNSRHHERAPLPSQLMNVPALPQRQEDKANIRSFSPDPTSYSASFEPPAPIETTAIVPYTQAAESPITTIVTESAEAKKSGFSISDIKQVIDRMGGIDGIVETMGKVQKVMNSVSQIAPVAKLLMGTLLPGKKKDEEAEDENEYRPKRKRRRKRTTGRNRTPSSGKQRQRTIKSPRRH